MEETRKQTCVKYFEEGNKCKQCWIGLIINRNKSIKVYKKQKPKHHEHLSRIIIN